ncbi:MAG: hypothetical protein ACXADY_12490 [Candidatus Hodarchaeales archaeon]|jgi:hypothetical protein
MSRNGKRLEKLDAKRENEKEKMNKDQYLDFPPISSRAFSLTK